MGKATKILKEEFVEKENKIKSLFISHNQKVYKIGKEPVETLYEHYNWLFSEYESYFIRDIDSFKIKTKSKYNDSTHVLELFRHLLSKYPISKPFKNAWVMTKVNENRQYDNVNGTYKITRKIKKDNITMLSMLNNAIEEVDFRKWAICLANGGSLYKEYAKPFLTKKEVHILTNCPHDLTMLDAIVYSIAKSASSNEGVSLKLAQSKLSTFLKNDVSFWRRVITFFIENHDCKLEKLNDFIDFIQAKKQNEAQLFNMLNGCTLKSLSIKMEEWHRELGRAKILGNYSWKGFPIDNKKYEKRNLQDQEYTWIFKQILNTKDLAAEGTRMRHCVLSYKNKCIEGTASIWSLEQEKNGITAPKITLEISEDYRIVQARGFANRSPKTDELNIINEWSSDIGLTKNRY